MPKGKFEDLAGRTFGALKVERRDETRAGGSARWVCSCECGNTCIVTSSNLSSGNTMSCGCKRRRKPNGMNRPEKAKPGYCYNVLCPNRHNYKGAWSYRHCRGCWTRVVTRRSKRQVLKLGKEID